MENGHWSKVKEIFAAALQQKPQDRPKYVRHACGDDKYLLEEIESLLTSLDEADEFLEAPAIDEVADAFENQTAKIAAGKSFGHYEIIRQIGYGGMGEVYLAKDQKLDRQVALKILNEDFSRHESNLQRFVQEAKAASSLNHPNILIIHEIGEANQTNYIASEYIEGKTLRQIIKAAPLSLNEVLDISIQVAGALSAAHQAHIVHRDIKPENIMLRPDGYVKILDFGLAKLIEQKSLVGLEEATPRQNETAQGIILGTVNYMSPEQAKGEKVDERTDIFSFGEVLYEMIAGQTPFQGDSISETFANLINSEPPPLARYAAVPDGLRRIVSKMLRKDRARRYQTVNDLLADLKALNEEFLLDKKAALFSSSKAEIATRPVQIKTAELNQKTGQTQYGLTRQIRRHRYITGAALTAFLIGAVCLGYYLTTAKQAASWRAEKDRSPFCRSSIRVRIKMPNICRTGSPKMLSIIFHSCQG